VFDAIARSAARLCDAHSAIVSVLDGDVLRLVALHGASEDATRVISAYFPMPLASEALSARAARTQAIVNVPDALADPADPFTASRPWRQRRSGGTSRCGSTPKRRPRGR